ncbi:MAG: PH domain-containing protein [Beijerinckiaceae bacterium]
MTQERFRWSLWPICVGWLLAAWLAWHGLHDLRTLLGGYAVNRGFTFGWLSLLPRWFQIMLAGAQVALILAILPSLAGFLSRRTLLTIGDKGLTLDRWIGWTRIDWADVAKLEFRFGDAIFHVREGGRIAKLHFRPWTIGLDSDQFRDLVERHRPELTPDEDEGQPWARSSSFNS